MNVVFNNPGIEDDYSQEVISKACELSPELSEYVVTQAYLRETPEENLSPLWLRNKMVCRLVEQLRDMGIVLDVDTDDVCDSPQLVYAVLHLRAKFDVEALYEFLKHRPELLDHIRELLDDVNCIEEIITHCHHLLPLDEGWEMLNALVTKRPGVVTSDGPFGELMDGVITRVDRLGDPGVVTAGDENLSMVLDYTGFLGNRKNNIAETAKNIYGAKVSLESADGKGEVVKAESREVAINGYMRGFEKELARANVVETLDPDTRSLDISGVRAKYLPKWRHTLEYWTSDEHREQIPTELDMAVMVATLFVDFGGGAGARVKVIDRFEQCMDRWGNRYDSIRDMLDDALANLAMIQEVNNAK